MQTPNLQARSARPSSPVSSGSTGPFSNKRRKLDPFDTLVGLAKGTTAWQTSLPAVNSDQMPITQLERPAFSNSNAGVACDADSDPHDAGGTSLHQKAASSLTQAVLGSCHFNNQHVSTAAPSLLASPEQLPTEAGDSVHVEYGSAYRDQSPAYDDTSGDASVPICPMNPQYHQAKGKECIGPSPLPQYDPEQESKLDHIRMGNWVWWKFDCTWTFARVREHCGPYVNTIASELLHFELKRIFCGISSKAMIKQGR